VPRARILCPIHIELATHLPVCGGFRDNECTCVYQLLGVVAVVGFFFWDFISELMEDECVPEPDKQLCKDFSAAKMSATAEPAVDFLVVSDQSSGMAVHNTKLAGMLNLSPEGFLTAMKGVTSNWQLIVANSDGGCQSNTGGILKPSTDNLLARFSAAVQHWTGVQVSSTAALLETAAKAVEKTKAGGCNAGFLRPEALLHVVLFSDASPPQLDTALKRIRALKDPRLTQVSAFRNYNSTSISLKVRTDAAAAAGANTLHGVDADIADPVWSRACRNPPQSMLDDVKKCTIKRQKSFQSNADPLVDIIFVTDTSSSMKPYIARLTNNLKTYISELGNIKWNMVVANAANGCNNPKYGILTPQTPNYEAKFTAAVADWTGDQYPFTETQIVPALYAAQGAEPGKCNAGLLRPEALLHVVLVSDSQTPWEPFLKELVKTKGSANLVKVSVFRNKEDPGRREDGTSKLLAPYRNFILDAHFPIGAKHECDGTEKDPATGKLCVKRTNASGTCPSDYSDTGGGSCMSEPGYGFRQLAAGMSSDGNTRLSRQGLDADILTVNWTVACFNGSQQLPEWGIAAWLGANMSCDSEPKCTAAHHANGTLCQMNLMEELGQASKVTGSYAVPLGTNATDIVVKVDNQIVHGPSTVKGRCEDSATWKDVNGNNCSMYSKAANAFAGAKLGKIDCAMAFRLVDRSVGFSAEDACCVCGVKTAGRVPNPKCTPAKPCFYDLLLKDSGSALHFNASANLGTTIQIEWEEPNQGCLVTCDGASKCVAPNGYAEQTGPGAECYRDYVAELAAASTVKNVFKVDKMPVNTTEIVVAVNGLNVKGPKFLLDGTPNPACGVPSTCKFEVQRVQESAIQNSAVLYFDDGIVALGGGGGSQIALTWAQPKPGGCITVPGKPCPEDDGHNIVGYVLFACLLIMLIILICQAVSWQKERVKAAKQEIATSADGDRGSENLEVLIKFDGDTHNLDLSPQMTISEVKAAIEKAAGIPAAEQHLYFEDHSQLQLEGFQTLESVQVRHTPPKYWAYIRVGPTETPRSVVRERGERLS
jgi:hypothetical protein